MFPHATSSPGLTGGPLSAARTCEEYVLPQSIPRSSRGMTLVKRHRCVVVAAGEPQQSPGPRPGLERSRITLRSIRATLAGA